MEILENSQEVFSEGYRVLISNNSLMQDQPLAVYDYEQDGFVINNQVVATGLEYEKVVDELKEYFDTDRYGDASSVQVSDLSLEMVVRLNLTEKSEEDADAGRKATLLNYQGVKPTEDLHQNK